MVEETVLELTGMGGFIPYSTIENLVRKTGKIIVSLDADAVPLVEKWARRRGYAVEHLGEGKLRILSPAEAAAAKPQAVPARVEAPVLEPSAWDGELARRLADISYVLSIVLRAPIIYRGPVNLPDFRAALTSKGPILLRVQLNATDYFLLIRDGRVVAAAQLGAELNPEQAKNILDHVFEKGDMIVTVYNLSSANL
ncbi:hypothetical protein [Hyperthermus butylicus]|uniref:Uncharacterized protein n=1 Tax=Hyperthermus butylicus (strain DSM 5456 / JCM 9403 / PLM1-5) TaxID=415426 RepID=A2BJG2_HYPBU|nr:hypothetical protein [Hyperthermus butylicus]ABM80123.1 hypothetical protein Hbut_0251 [Hyperthermus butylicus DSM 5456]